MNNSKNYTIVSHLDKITNLPEVEFDDEFLVIDLHEKKIDTIARSIFVGDFCKKINFISPIEVFMNDILLAFQVKSDCRKAIESAYLADRLRQKLYIKNTKMQSKLVEFFPIQKIIEYPILMAIFNQVSAVPMLRPIDRYLKYHFGDEILLLDGKKSLNFTISSRSSKKYDDMLDFDESFTITISKLMKIFRFTDSEPLEIGEVLMSLKLFHVISFDEISMFLPNIKFNYAITMPNFSN
jgi:hypothetical protein